MDDIIIGECTEEHYVLIGKMADGTPVYKHNPPPPPDPVALYKAREKIVEQYNTTTEYEQVDTTDFLEVFTEEEEKERKQQELKSRLSDNHRAKEVKPDTLDDSKTLEYFEDSTSTPLEYEPVETNQYLDLFKAEEQRQKAIRLRAEKFERQRAKRIEDDIKRSEESAAKYKALSESLKEERSIEIEEYEAAIKEIETLLQEEYQQLLEDGEFEGFYIDGDEYYTEAQLDTKNVIVTNKRTNTKKYFNYIGDLQSINIKEHRLVLYSMVKGDSGYGILREGYKYITHRSIAFNLKTGRMIDKESSIISKSNPLCDSLLDACYGDGDGGLTNRNRELSALRNSVGNREAWWSWDQPGNDVAEIGPFITDINDAQPWEEPRLVPAQIIPTEIIIEAYGSGGAGTAGYDNSNAGGYGWGAGGGGGSYMRKTFRISPLQRYPLLVYVHIGTGEHQEAGNDTSVWNADIVRPSKDTYSVLENYKLEDANRTISPPITSGAGGGYDGTTGPLPLSSTYWTDVEIASAGATPYPLSAGILGNNAAMNMDNLAGPVWPGYPGTPFGDYDVGYIGFGYKPWSTLNYHISAYMTEAEFAVAVLEWEVNGDGSAGGDWNTAGAHLWGDGSLPKWDSYTLLKGVSSGQVQTEEQAEDVLDPNLPGANPTGGGHAGWAFDSVPPGTWTNGTSGGQGELHIIVTKGIVNRLILGDTIVNMK